MPSHRRFRGFLAFAVCLAAFAGVWLWSRRPRAQAGTAVAAQASSSKEGFPYTNRLIHEKSPYLLLHAHNPVAWYPWGSEAFERARREQKPIFLSIGYYTCHWCHVMERESYSDPGIAETLNRDFVAIKVDREERPDVDRLYIAYVEATTGSAGWPLNVFLTPELKPFFGGTYFPRDDSGGQPGLRTLLLRIADAWVKDRQKIIQTANSGARELTQFVSAATPNQGALKTEALDKGYRQIAGTYDPVNGGFGGAPKFPRPVVFDFLLRTYARTGQKGALEMTVESLRAMARGGIHDQIGGGFHRYTTDNRWRVPHFEKMLYDQAQLACVYVEAYQATHDPFFAATARDILDFVLHEMNGPDGGFVSAEDADSQAVAGKSASSEGAYYVWTAKQIEEILGKADAEIFDYAYGVEPDGNVPAGQDVRGELQGKNVLFEAHTLAETGKRFVLSEAETRSKLAAARKRLLQARSQRPPPLLDDKVVTAWNGLMIGALARASQVLDEPRYLAASQAAANFIHAKLYDEESTALRRRYRAGDAAVDGFLDDYAFLIAGLLDLYEASFDVSYLEWAVSLQSKQDQLFWDAQQGGYFDASGADSSLLARTREAYDGAEPSPNSVAAMNLLRLAQITDHAAWRDEAEKTFAAFGNVLADSPADMPGLASALDFHLAKTKQILIAGRPDAPDTRALLKLVHERFLPNKILLLADGGPGQQKLAHWLPFVAGATEIQGHATAYICENYVCKLPTDDPRKVARLLDGKS